MRKIDSLILLSLLVLFLGTLFLASFSVHADSLESQADQAVAGILFENDADEFISYSIESDGAVDITYANNTPDKIYNKINSELRAHKSIKSIMPGRGGPSCSLF